MQAQKSTFRPLKWLHCQQSQFSAHYSGRVLWKATRIRNSTLYKLMRPSSARLFPCNAPTTQKFSYLHAESQIISIFLDFCEASGPFHCTRHCHGHFQANCEPRNRVRAPPNPQQWCPIVHSGKTEACFARLFFQHTTPHTLFTHYTKLGRRTASPIHAGTGARLVANLRNGLQIAPKSQPTHKFIQNSK